MADEILTPGDEQIKALFVTGGTPLLTMANSERLSDAFDQLDMLVVTDIYMNETASKAHYILPATSPLQRPDLPFIFALFLGMQSKPYLSATDAIVAPKGLQRDVASIYTDLATASGVSLFDSKAMQISLRLMKTVHSLFNRKQLAGIPQRFIMDLMLRLSKNGRFKDIANMADGKPWQGAKANSFLGQRLTTDDGLVDLAPAMFIDESLTLERIFAAETAAEQSGQLRLITKRAHSTHNSWTQNIEELTNGRMGQTNYLYMHPSDANKHQLAEGESADIASATGKIRLPVKFLDELMPGVVAVPHGWGHQPAKGLSVASNIAGANVNILASDGPENIERVSGMAHLTGIPVTVSASQEPVNRASWSGI